MKLKSDYKSQLIFRSIVLAFGLVAFIFAVNEPRVALYYTNWSCYFGFLAILLGEIGTCIALFRKNDKLLDNLVYKMIKVSSTVMIIATFIVAAFVLPTKIWTIGYWNNPGSIFKHFCFPILLTLDTILCDKPCSYKFWFAFTNPVPPLLYWVIIIARFMTARNSFGGHIPEEQWGNYYPYGFTNIDKSASLGGLIGLLAGILVAMIGMGIGLYFLNKRIGVKKEISK